MSSSNQSSRKLGGAEQWVGFIILLCLAGIAVGVYLKQFSFNPAVLAAATVAPEAAKAASTPASGDAAPILPALPPELRGDERAGKFRAGRSSTTKLTARRICISPPDSST